LVEAHSGLARALIAKKDLDGASRHLQNVLKREPKSALLQFDLATVLLERRDLEEAITTFEAAIKLDSAYRYQAARKAAVHSGAHYPVRGAARLRRQSLEWLRQELDALEKQAVERAGDRSRIRSRLDDWRNDPELDEVRDQYDLRQMPATEAVAWRTFWNDLATVLDRLSVP
jgi:tetratricopeptide (TPR) repeat protein